MTDHTTFEPGDIVRPSGGVDMVVVSIAEDGSINTRWTDEAGKEQRANLDARSLKHAADGQQSAA